PALPEPYTLSLHDALPIYTAACGGERAVGSWHFHRNGRCTAFQQTCRASTTARHEPGSPEPEAHADAEGMLVDTGDARFLEADPDRKSTRLNSSHVKNSYA